MIAPELQNVINLCVEGNYLEALPVLQGAADKGDVEASLACAKVFCYQNQWHEAGMYASKMVLSFKHQTDFDLLLDSWRIVTLSGICTGDWQLADNVVAKCENHYDKKDDKKSGNKPAKNSEVVSVHAKAKSHPRVTYYRAFKKMIKRRGAGSIAYPVFPEPRDARKDRLLNFRRAEERVLSSQRRKHAGKNLSGWWGQRVIDDIFIEAVDCGLPEKAKQFYIEYGRYPSNHFALLFLARVFIGERDYRRASYSLRRSIQTYEPASPFDLLPVALFWIPEIREFLVPHRVEKLLALKRDILPAINFENLSREHSLDVFNSKGITFYHSDRAEQSVSSEIARWEANLSQLPGELLLRIKLCKYYNNRKYHSTDSRNSLARHMFWFIENQPEVRALDFYSFFDFYYNYGKRRKDRTLNQRLYQKGKRLWLRQVELNPCSKAVCLSASSYFFLEDDELSENILWSALEHNPDDSEILDRIYYFLSLRYKLISDRDLRKGVCERMLRALRLLMPMKDKEYNAQKRVAAAAWCAMELARFDDAKVFANQVITDLNKSGGEPLSLCYSALGMVAMTEGKHKEALADLDKAFGAIEDSNFRDAAAAMILASGLAGSHKTGVLKILCKYRDRADNKVKRELKHFVELIENGGEMKYLNGNSLMPSLS